MAKDNDEMMEATTEETQASDVAQAAPNSKFEPRQYVTFDTSDIKNRVKIFNAHNSAVSFKNVGETPVNIVDVMAEVGVRTQSNNSCQNSYIFSDDGNVYFSQSNGIAKTLNELVDMVDGDFAANTTSGYVTVQMQSTALSGDRTYKQLKLVAA